ncbi:MAG: 67, gp67 [Acidimicrobiales bacterium]|nr:67, gp67 [Acidimicrobiales bacterium]
MSRTLDDLRYAIQAGACAASRWAGDPGRCRWCDAPARPEAAWCSHPCEDEYRRNHWWDQAREAALVRDGSRCRHCGLGPAVPTTAKALLRALIPMRAIEAARLWQTPAWRALEQACQLEVNHLVPRLGRGYQAGCHHHLDNLETLCHRCHVAVTTQQQADRRAAG